MKVVTTVIKTIDRINEFVTKYVQWLVLVLVFTLVYEVIMRYIFRSPTLWSFDVSYMSASIFIMLGMGYTLQQQGHVNIDIIVEKFSRRTQAVFNIIFMLLLFFPLWFSIMDVFIPHLIRSWAIGERASVGTWLPPIYPFKTWLLAGMVLLFLQGISEFLKEILVLSGRRQQ